MYKDYYVIKPIHHSQSYRQIYYDNIFVFNSDGLSSIPDNYTTSNQGPSILFK